MITRSAQFACSIVLGNTHAVPGAPGANDNGSGVAAILELTDRFKDKSFPLTVRFVAFVNEEPPNSLTGNMGSFVYAKKAAKDKENIIAMFLLETIGYFSDEPGSQQYPPPFIPFILSAIGTCQEYIVTAFFRVGGGEFRITQCTNQRNDAACYLDTDQPNGLC